MHLRTIVENTMCKRLNRICTGRTLAIGIAMVVACVMAIASKAQTSPLRFPNAGSAGIGVVVTDLATGATVIDYNGDRLLTPASITKCVTAAAIEMAGLANERYSTKAYLRGSIDAGGRLLGDVVIKADGDPTLEAGRFSGKSELIKAVREALKRDGIREIYGAIDVDSTLLKEPGPVPTWEYGDLRHAYGAGLHALNYRDNATGASQLALGDPSEELVIALEEQLLADGIQTLWNDVTQPATLQPLAETESATLAEILRVTLETSHNLYAEALLRRLVPEGTRADALRREHQLLTAAGMDENAHKIVDGSGLTRANALSPRFMASLLQYCASQPWGERYVSYFPFVGREGTVKRLLSDTPLAGQLALKSGSMNGVQTFAGYRVDHDGHPTHAVVIMVNNFTAPRQQVVKAIETFLLNQFNTSK